MGASGSGKTTLLNCISTIDTISAGRICLDGAFLFFGRDLQVDFQQSCQSTAQIESHTGGTDLADIVSQAVGNHRTLLIQNHMKVETGDLDFTVYTDRKCLGIRDGAYHRPAGAAHQFKKLLFIDGTGRRCTLEEQVFLIQSLHQRI